MKYFFLVRARLDDPQLNRLSEILADIGQIFFAAMVVSPFVTGLDKVNWRMLTLGLGTSVGFWWASVWLAKEKPWTPQTQMLF